MRAFLPRYWFVILILTVGAALYGVGVSAQEAGDAVPSPDAQWCDAMRGARADYQTWRGGQVKGAEVSFGAWYATQPMKADSLADVKFPERRIELEAKTPDGKRIWEYQPNFLDGASHGLSCEGSNCIYLTREIKASAPVTVKAGFGSDDGIAVWLNGTQVLAQDAKRIVGPDEDVVDLALAAGENRLLVKIFNAQGGCGFYFALAGDPLYGIWSLTAQDFPEQCGWMERDNPGGEYLSWFSLTDTKEAQQQMIRRVLDKAGDRVAPLRAELDGLASSAADDPAWLNVYARACRAREGLARLDHIDFAALRRAVADLSAAYPERYTRGAEFQSRTDEGERRIPELIAALNGGNAAAQGEIDALVQLQREALLSNPLLDFEKLLLVKRGEGSLGLPQNWQGNCAMGSRGYDNEIAVLSPVTPDGAMTTLYKPEGGAFVGDVDLHFDANKMLFSMPGSQNRWQIWEIGADGQGLRQVTPGEEPDVDNYDACYLPDERITFASTRCYQGVPCVGGSNTVANLCRMDADGANARQLCFDQDHNWCPTLQNNGRVMYSRWEYSDTPHYFSRLLFNMNPDGTNQAEYYGSNSYWPNSIFYARPIPGHPSAVVAIISGHHGVPRMGELIILDPAKSRFEGSGVVQRIPGYGKKVEPVIMDTLVDAVWPRFLHPYPLSDKYFLVSCQPDADTPWGLYLVDVFDNMLLLKEMKGYALFEPIPFRPTSRPPAIPDRVRLDEPDATVYLTDVYRGEGLRGVPRGTIKNLRIFEIYYTYPQMGGHVNIGVEGPWDVHRILGTVPVHEDGSAYFKIPANTPVAVQPLDGEGRAVQIMRSWFVGMPGEAVSCVGCHERQNMTPPPAPALASLKAPDDITPWKGPARGFSFKRDVQPVLDRHCVGCHDGAARPDGKQLPDFTRKEKNGWNNFTPSYLALHPFVRRPGPESDYHVQKPTEFSATTSELIQMLEKGHHGVQLDADAWDRLYTWIDLNVPDHGTWHEHRDIPNLFDKRRKDLRARYACRPEDPEEIPALPETPVAFVPPVEEKPLLTAAAACDGWPLDEASAVAKQGAAGAQTKRTIDLGNGVTMDLVLIPAGTFVMGANEGDLDERPMTPVTIANPFWMGVCEVTNAQYQQFDPSHDNGFIDQQNKDHTMPGYTIQAPGMPAVRIPWTAAMEFCRWMSGKLGEPCTLPTEAEWEWACRNGSAAPFWYGDMDADFSACANLADLSIRRLAVAGINPQPIENPSPYDDFLPKDARFDDGQRIMTEVMSYKPSPWGLYDMHGNASEWTRSAYAPYPYVDGDGRNSGVAEGKKVVRGGSWFDRPKRARASFRLGYEWWQPVYNVSFRVVIPAAPAGQIVAQR